MKKAVWLVGILSFGCLVMGIDPVRAHEGHAQIEMNEDVDSQLQSAMGNIVNSYLIIRDKLAADSVEGIGVYAQKIVQQGKALEELHIEHLKLKDDTKEKYRLITETGKYAIQLSHGDIKAIRRLFAHLSHPIIKYVEKFGVPYNIKEKLHIYYCPMYQGYWLQESENVGNPFYGKEMLKCAEVVEGGQKKQEMLNKLYKIQEKSERHEEHEHGHEHHDE